MVAVLKPELMNFSGDVYTHYDDTAKEIQSGMIGNDSGLEEKDSGCKEGKIND